MHGCFVLSLFITSLTANNGFINCIYIDYTLLIGILQSFLQTFEQSKRRTEKPFAPNHRASTL
nr:MAG TPA: hypothetical protein [Caudoviricetes sp.]